MIASLPMYDWPEVQPTTDRLWAGLRDRLRACGINAPDALTRGGDLWADWQSPDLLLSQTCGLPYRTRLHGQVALVGTPDFGLTGAEPGYYYSILLVQAEAPGDCTDFLGGRLAINSFDSQSGWAAPQNHAVAAGRMFERVVETGAHPESARAVAEGRADIASVDAVTWRLIAAHRPQIAQQLRIVARTDPTPGLPLITARGHDVAVIGQAFRNAAAALSDADRAALGLRGLAEIPADAYLAVPTPARLDPIEGCA